MKHVLPVGTSPGHRALELVSRLVALLDKYPAASTYASGRPELQALVQSARSIAEKPSQVQALPPAEGEGFYRWCPACNAQHVFVDERRKAVRA